MPRPRKKVSQETSLAQPMTVEMSGSVLERALENALHKSFQPFQEDIQELAQRTSLLEQDI